MIRNKSLYAYIKYVSCKKRESAKSKEWRAKYKLTPLHEMWLDLVK